MSEIKFSKGKHYNTKYEGKSQKIFILEVKYEINFELSLKIFTSDSRERVFNDNFLINVMISVS